MPIARAAANIEATSTGARPGLLNTAHTSVPSTKSGVKGPLTKRAAGTSRCKAANWGGAARVSATVTCAPLRAHQCAIASPDVPRPRMRMCWFCRWVSMTAALAQFQGRQTDQAQQHGDDPKTHHHLRFFPATFFKVVVQRGHLKKASTLAVALFGELEPAHLQHD